jgi:hypothetical protein
MSAPVAPFTARPATATVLVDTNERGAWEIALPDQRARLTCETLDAARREAYRCATERRPCELIVRDAYHRVLSRELVHGPGAERGRS